MSLELSNKDYKHIYRQLSILTRKFKLLDIISIGEYYYGTTGPACWVPSINVKKGYTSNEYK